VAGEDDILAGEDDILAWEDNILAGEDDILAEKPVTMSLCSPQILRELV
jgi:hypothetical protein